LLPELYDSMFARKSVRKFDPAPLGADILGELTAFMNDLVPMHGEIALEHVIVPGNDVRSPFRPKPPHYILIFSEPKEGYLVNAGFMMQQVDLFLSHRGIGSCWQLIPRPTKHGRQSSSLDYIIAMAIGSPAEPVHRQSRDEFDRKPNEKITSISGMNEIMDAVRLAPSGMNTQPWFFTGDATGMLHAYCTKLNPLLKLVIHKMDEVSVGIAICHAWIAISHLGNVPEFLIDETARDNPPKGYYYITSLKFS